MLKNLIFKKCKKKKNSPNRIRSSLVAQQVKDLALSLALVQLWCKFDPWPGNFCKPQVQQKKKKKVNRKMGK